MENPLVKELRDRAALITKSASDPFAARKNTLEWRAAERLETLITAAEDVVADYPVAAGAVVTSQSEKNNAGYGSIKNLFLALKAS